jgi:large subunit ribosomal protein L18
MNKIKAKNQRVERRKNRVRAKVSGTAVRPRLSVYRSLDHIYAQIIDDTAGVTLAGVKDVDVKEGKTKVEKAFAVGKLLAEKAKAKNVTAVVFDRGQFQYHGRIKAVAEGAKEGGLTI